MCTSRALRGFKCCPGSARFNYDQLARAREGALTLEHRRRAIRPEIIRINYFNYTCLGTVSPERGEYRSPIAERFSLQSVARSSGILSDRPRSSDCEVGMQRCWCINIARRLIVNSSAVLGNVGNDIDRIEIARQVDNSVTEYCGA